jgi:hypothetical protein
MVVNADSGKFITQRQVPKLCQVSCSVMFFSFVANLFPQGAW